MTIPLVVNGITYDYPQVGNEQWGVDATNWASAVTSTMLQKTGGLFTLSTEVDFGATAGIKALTYKDRSTNPATTGEVRLGNTSCIVWRNNGNDGNLPLCVGADDMLDFNGVDLVDVSSTQTLTNKTLTDPVITGGISGIALDDLDDVDTTGASSGEAITFNGVSWVPLPSSSTFLGLADTPSAYTASSLYYVRVNAALDALEFADHTFLTLSDVPASYTGQAGKMAIVTAGEDGLEFSAPVINIEDLGNVDSSAPVPSEDGFGYTWSQSAGEFVLTDVTNPQIVLNAITDVDAASPSDNDILQFDTASGDWVAGPTTGIVGGATLGDLGDVTLTGVADQELLTYNSGTGDWENAAPAARALDDLSDVTITSVTTSDLLYYNGSAWVNGTAGDADIDMEDLANVTITAPSVNDILYFTGAEWINGEIGSAINIQDLGNVDSTNPTAAEENYVYAWNDTLGEFTLEPQVGAPGGSTTQVQFNDASAFGGDANFTWDKTDKILGLSGDTTLVQFDALTPTPAVGDFGLFGEVTGITWNGQGATTGIDPSTGYYGAFSMFIADVNSYMGGPLPDDDPNLYYYDLRLFHNHGNIIMDSFIGDFYITAANGNMALTFENLTLQGATVADAAVGGDIIMNPGSNTAGSGHVYIDGTEWPDSIGAANTVLQSDGSGVASWNLLPFGDLDDVQLDPAGSIADGELVQWETSTQKWINRTVVEAGIQPTLAADQIIDHSTITITAGTGLSGGGTIDSSVSLAIDFNEFGTISPGSVVVGSDYAVIYDTSAGNQKKIIISDFLSLAGAANNLQDLANVNASAPTIAEDGYVYAWDNTAGEFQLVAPTAGTGDVVGPASAVDNNFASFDLTTGKLIQDSGSSASSFATAAQGSTADSATQPGDNISTLTNDAGYTTNVGDVVGPASSVTARIATFDGVTGKLLQDSGSLVSDFATSAQGALADSATQPGDNISTLTNDSGFTTNVGDVVGPASSVTARIATFDGTTGKLLQDSGSLVSDFATSAQGALADSATQPGDNVSDLTNDAGYTTNTGDVVGPASAVDNRLATFDGITGKLVQDSGTLVSDLATSAQGALADSATQPGDNISTLTNDSGFTTNTGDVVGPASSVTARIATFDGTTGKLIQDSGSLVSDFATSAQGALADSATQPGDNVSTLTNDSGFIDNTVTTLSSLSITESQISDLTHTDPDAIHDNVAGEINAITAKATPVDADVLLIEDSADSFNKKKITIGDIAGGASTLNDLTDVTITTPADNNLLAYDTTSSKWINQTAAAAGLATSAQGALADSATQPGDNISTLTNDSGFTTNVGDVVGPASAVTARIATFDGTTGKLLQDSGSLVSDFATSAQGSLADSATQPGDNISTLTNDSGFTTNTGDVVGPASAVDNNFASFDLTTGKLIQDSGSSASSFATAAQGSLADSATQPGDNVSDLTNDAGYTTNVGDVVGPASSVTARIATFDGTTGKLLQDSGSLVSDFATSAQGALADSATQPGDNVSDLTNDAGYTTNTGDVVGPASSVTARIATFDGTTGKLLQDSGSLVSDFATSAQGALADSATQPGDNVSTLTNDSGFIDNTVTTLSSLSITESQISDLGAYITAVVEDTTPQLGGDLDVNGSDIVSVSNGDINITPNGTGKTVVTNLEAAATLNTQTGTTYAPVIADADKMITLNNASAITATIPANASVAYPVGTKLNFMQLGAGQVTVAITSDTLSFDASLTAKLNGQYAVATALKVTTTQWVLFGNLEPA